MSEKRSRFEMERERLSHLTRAARFDELIQFPTRHLFKVIGAGGATLEQDLRELLARRGFSEVLLVERPSRTGRWLAFSFELEVHCGEQLSELYDAMEALQGVRCLF